MTRRPEGTAQTVTRTIEQGLTNSTASPRLCHRLKRPNLLDLIAFFAFLAIGGAVLSTIVTYAVWNTAIEPKAFQCVDDIGIFDSYWCDMDAHAAAGDTILPGWTWEKLKMVRVAFIVGFFALWALSTLIPFRMVLRRIRQSDTILEPTRIGTGDAR